MSVSFSMNQEELANAQVRGHRLAMSQIERFLIAQRKLYEEGTYADLELVHGNHTYRVHRAIVCPRSEMIASAAKSSWQHGEEHVAKVALLYGSDEDPMESAMMTKLMIHYFYALDYTNPSVDSLRQSGEWVPEPDEAIKYCNPLLLHSRMYGIADFYQIQDLKDLAKQNFQNNISVGWASPSLAEALHIVFHSTPSTDRGLRDIVISTLGEHIEVVDIEAVSNIIRTIPDLAFEVLKAHRAKMDGKYLPRKAKRLA